jgi:hypothetical protein
VTHESLLTKIKNMLALSNDACNENEAATAAAMAQRFMLKHNLCMADVEDLDAAISEASEITEDQVIAPTGRLPQWKRTLLHSVAHAFGCRTLLSRQHVWNGPIQRSMKLVGSAEDIAVATATYQYLKQAIDRMVSLHASGNGRSYVNAYRIGMAERIGDRLRSQARATRNDLQEQATEAGTAMVLAKDASLKDYMAKFKMTGHRRPSQVDFNGYEHGRSDGSRVGLNAQIDAR